MRKGKARVTINVVAKKMTMLFDIRIATRFPDAKKSSRFTVTRLDFVINSPVL